MLHIQKSWDVRLKKPQSSISQKQSNSSVRCNTNMVSCDVAPAQALACSHCSICVVCQPRQLTSASFTAPAPTAQPAQTRSLHRNPAVFVSQPKCAQDQHLASPRKYVALEAELAGFWLIFSLSAATGPHQRHSAEQRAELAFGTQATWESGLTPRYPGHQLSAQIPFWGARAYSSPSLIFHR